MSMNQTTEVLYNAQCPVCSREVDHYARLSKDGALPITFADLNAPDHCADWGVTPEQAARRFHVRKGSETYVGVDAFVVLWSDIPKYRWIARLVSKPGVYQLANWVYDLVLAPMLYASHKRRLARSVRQAAKSASR